MIAHRSLPAFPPALLRRALSGAAMLALLSIGVAGCSLFGAKPEADTALRDQLVALEKQSWAAWQAHDGLFFADFLSDDHVEMGSGGAAGKAAIITFVASPACRIDNYAVDNFTLTRFAPDTALLVYRAEQKTVCNGIPVQSPSWVSSLYVRRNGKWQNALYQKMPTTR